jgi:hypothetical protein
MGKLEREAKHVTAGILEVRGAILDLGRRADWVGGILGGQGSDLLSGCSSCSCVACCRLFFRCASIMLSGCVISRCN